MAQYNCTYGSNKTPDVVYVYNEWYVVDGSKNVNKTYDEFYDGINVEEINDIDTFSWNEPICSEEELENAVNL